MSSTNAPEPARRAAPRRRSLAARLTAWYTGSAFVLILAAIAFLYWALVNTLEREDDQFLTDKAQVLLAILNEAPGDERELRQELERESAPRPSGQLYLRILGPGGRTVAETPGMAEQLPAAGFPEPIPPGSTHKQAVEINTPGGHSYRALALHASAATHVVQVAMDRTVEEELLASYRRYAGVTLVIGLVVCALVGYALARRALRPLHRISRAAARIRSSTLHERLEAGALPAELATLAATFNEMLDRLEESFQRLERFSADIAHELRTPVNNLRGEVEVALGQPRSPEDYRDILSSSLEEFARLADLIDSLLFLARAESPQAMVVKQRLDVGQELATVREYYDAAAGEAGITLTVRAAPNLVAQLDRTLFQRAVGNLVGNALAHTPRGGAVTLSAERIGAGVRIEVADTGHGIAPEHLPHVFDRFYRVDPARTSGAGSVGLGLSLVKSIAALHGGACAISSEPGRGTCVRLDFPAPALV